MRRKPWLTGFAFGFFLAVGLPETGPTTLAQPAKRKLTINLYVYNYAQVPERTLREAENQAGEIFGKIGVNTLWVLVPFISVEKQLEFLFRRSQNSAGLDLRISIPSPLTVKTMEKHLGRQDHVFGLSMYAKDQPGHLAYVFYHRIEEFVQARNLHEHKARILGLAVAHEIGHLLLPLHSHSSRGVMRATWDREDFELAARGNLGFTPKQAELIRSEVLRRSESNLEVP